MCNLTDGRILLRPVFRCEFVTVLSLVPSLVAVFAARETAIYTAISWTGPGSFCVAYAVGIALQQCEIAKYPGAEWIGTGPHRQSARRELIHVVAAERLIPKVSEGDMAALLPDDVLADVLRRLAPRDLAASRSVCAAWRAVVDGRFTLREEAELLPLSLASLLIKYNYAYPVTEFFARPSRRTKKGTYDSIPGRRDFLAEGEIGAWSTVLDHCNGLLLTGGDDDDDDGFEVLSVVNPATRRRARLPPYPLLRVEINAIEEYYSVPRL